MKFGILVYLNYTDIDMLVNTAVDKHTKATEAAAAAAATQVFDPPLKKEVLEVSLR